MKDFIDLDKLSKMGRASLGTAAFLGLCFVAHEFFEFLKGCKD